MDLSTLTGEPLPVTVVQIRASDLGTDTLPTLAMAGYLEALHRAGWHLHAPTGPGTPLHDAYAQATTVAWLGIVGARRHRGTPLTAP